MKPHRVFASGVARIGMDKRSDVRWVAVRGGIHDWAIYCGKLEQSEEAIKNYGDKILTSHWIRKLVSCDDEAFAMYRL